LANVFERVRDVIVRQLKVQPDEVRPEASLTDDLRADSLDVVDLVIALEEEFSSDGNELVIADEDAENIHTVQDIIDFLEQKGVAA
jgi:acyl carrier protein